MLRLFHAFPFSLLVATPIHCLSTSPTSASTTVVTGGGDDGTTRINEPINVIVVGGSSGMGKAAAIAAVRRGGRALLVSRSSDRLLRASEEVLSHAPASPPSRRGGGRGRDERRQNDGDSVGEVGSVVQTAVLDASDESAVEAFAETLTPDEWDGLVFSAAGRAPHGPLTTLPTERTRELFETKFWGAYHCAKHISPKLRDGGAVAFVSGVLNRRPGINCSPLACTNGALEGLTRSLALEFGPRLRVNCLSPGFCDTERFDHMDPDKREAMLRNTAESLPLRRVGTPGDMGEALHYLLTAPFCTGVVLDVDGGHGIRQYASAATDPMRTRQGGAGGDGG